jgi:hypothetical protein
VTIALPISYVGVGQSRRGFAELQMIAGLIRGPSQGNLPVVHQLKSPGDLSFNHIPEQGH